MSICKKLEIPKTCFHGQLMQLYIDHFPDEQCAAVYNVRCNYLSQKLLQHACLICIKYRRICIDVITLLNVTLPSLLGPSYHSNDFLN